MFKHSKRILSFILAMVLFSTMTLTAAATSVAVDPDTLVANYVPELYEMSEDEVIALSDADVKTYFEEMFGETYYFSKSEMRTAVENYAKILKMQEELGISSNARASVTTSGYSAPNPSALCWVKDTTQLTYTEITTMSYVLEVDFLKPTTATMVAAAGVNYNQLQQMVDSLNGVNEWKGYCEDTLDASFPFTWELVCISLVVAAKYLDVSIFEPMRIKNALTGITDSQQLKVTFTFNNGTILRSYAKVSNTAHYSNPGGGRPGFWYTSAFAYCDMSTYF